MRYVTVDYEVAERDVIEERTTEVRLLAPFDCMNKITALKELLRSWQDDDRG